MWFCLRWGTTRVSSPTHESSSRRGGCETTTLLVQIPSLIYHSDLVRDHALVSAFSCRKNTRMRLQEFIEKRQKMWGLNELPCDSLVSICSIRAALGRTYDLQSACKGEKETVHLKISTQPVEANSHDRNGFCATNSTSTVVLGFCCDEMDQSQDKRLFIADHRWIPGGLSLSWGDGRSHETSLGSFQTLASQIHQTTLSWGPRVFSEKSEFYKTGYLQKGERMGHRFARANSHSEMFFCFVHGGTFLQVFGSIYSKQWLVCAWRQVSSVSGPPNYSSVPSLPHLSNSSGAVGFFFSLLQVAGSFWLLWHCFCRNFADEAVLNKKVKSQHCEIRTRYKTLFPVSMVHWKI